MRYEKNLSNGIVVVVEREGFFDVDDMENITMWAKKRSATNVTVDQKPSHSTSETIVISEADAAKIRKDAEDAIRADEKISMHRVFHGSGADFDAFDHSHMGEGEGAQAYGYGVYVASDKGYAFGYTSLGYVKSSEELSKAARTEDEKWLYGYLDRSTSMFGRKGTEAIQHGIRMAQRKLSDLRWEEENMEKDHQSEIAQKERELKILQSAENGEIEMPHSYMYTVEIPKDTGSNYLNWVGKIPEGLKEKVKSDIDKILSSIKQLPTYEEGKAKYIKDKGISEADFEDHYKSMMLQGIDKAGNVGELYRAVGIPKVASESLSSYGYTGIKALHPVQRDSGRRSAKDYEYVIFNESDAKITDKVRFFRTAEGEAYGFTVGGKIYIDPRIATAETPIHEYAHLWAAALRHSNPKEWQNVVKLMKESSAWEKIKGIYSHLKTDEEIADEVLAYYSGGLGARRLREEQKKIIADHNLSLHDKSAAIVALYNVRDALKAFWKGVCDMLHIHFTTAEDIADRVLLDMLEGVDPREIATDGSGTKFSIKNDNERKAAENAYNFAQKLRPNKDSRYAVVNMDRPGAAPLYEQKQSRARSECNYFNVLGWGNYKLMDLDKTFEENVATMSGKFPEEYEVRGDEKKQNESTTADDIEEIDKRFNEELDSFTMEDADSHEFDLGRPSAELVAAGVADKPIRLHGSKLAKKMKLHGFSAAELKGLPLAMQHPIAVFDNRQSNSNRSVLVELKTKDGNFLVTIDLGKGTETDFDIVSTVFGKRDDSIVNWINKGYLKYVDKEKALAFLHLSAPIAEASEKSRLDSATKIVENFENPSVEDDDLFRDVFGGNRGYVGYSMSRRAAEAREEGRYPKTAFVDEVNNILRSVGADEITMARWMGRYECPSLGSKDAHSMVL